MRFLATGRVSCLAPKRCVSASIGPEPPFRWTLGDATHNPSGLQVLACGGKACQSPIQDVRASLSHLGFKLQKMGGGRLTGLGIGLYPICTQPWLEPLRYLRPRHSILGPHSGRIARTCRKDPCLTQGKQAVNGSVESQLFLTNSPKRMGEVLVVCCGSLH